MKFHATAGTKRLVLAASIAAAFGAFAAPALSADMETILEKMHEKGLLTDEEYQEMRSQAREDRRKDALREAQAEEKAAKAKEEEASTLKGRFRDGFTLESGDKQHSISISGRIHADYRSFSEDSTNANSADTFDIRRAYLGVSGKLYEDWTFEVTSDVANSSLEYAYVNYKSSDSLQFRIGAFKMPFSFEELTSSRFIDFQERSLVNAFVPGKDQGFMIHGEPVKNTFAYAVAAMNGSGKNTDEANSVVDDKDLMVRAAVNLAPMSGMSDGVLHLGVNYSLGTIPGNVAPSSGVRTEGRGITFFTPVAPGAATNETDRKRLDLEGVVAWGPVKVQAEYLQASFDNSVAAYDRDINAYYASASWMLTGEKYADSYTLNGMRAIKPNRPFKKGGDGWGAWELGVRFSKLDASDLTSGQFDAAGTNQADAVTVGLKWIPVTPVRFYLNYTQTNFDTPVAITGGTTDSEKAVTLRASVFF
jgi:phosphate-selective porin OprO/OprP